MTTPLIVRDSVIMDRLLGHDVKSITVEGTKFYIVASVFKHFGRGSSQRFKDEFCRQFPGLRNHVVTYPKLREYCLKATTQSRVAHAKFMLLIANHETPALEVLQHVGAGAIVIPDVATMEASQLKEVVEKLGIGRVHSILQELGLLPKLCEDQVGGVEGSKIEQPRRKVVVTIEY